MSDDFFKPGEEVAVYYNGMGETQYRRHVVDKVYKNGNFTLFGSKQQWRPSVGTGERYASKTGSAGWDRESLIPWAEAEKEIAMQIESRKKNHDDLISLAARIDYTKTRVDLLQRIVNLIKSDCVLKGQING